MIDVNTARTRIEVFANCLREGARTGAADQLREVGALLDQLAQENARLRQEGARRVQRQLHFVMAVVFAAAGILAILVGQWLLP